MRILVDLDGIACDSLPVWLDWIYQDTGIRAEIKDIVSWNVHSCPPLDQVDPRDVYGVLNEPGFTEKLPVMPWAKWALENLRKAGHEIYFVTARHGDNAMIETMEWVRFHFPFLPVDTHLIFCYNKWLIEADVLIDDKAENVLKYIEHHPKAHGLAIGYPYNKELNNPHPRIKVFDYAPEAWHNMYLHINWIATEEEHND